MALSTVEVAVVGAGRRGRGIALSYGFARVPGVMLDVKTGVDERRARFYEWWLSGCATG